MSRNLLRLAILMIAAAAFTAGSSTKAEAHGGRLFHGYWGSYCGYDYGCYGYTSYRCYPRIFRRCWTPFVRRCCYPTYYHCYTPRCYSTCYTPYSYSYDSCCYGDSYHYGGTVIQSQGTSQGAPTPAEPGSGSAPVPDSAPVPTDGFPAPSEGGALQMNGRALLTVDVPEDAQVFVNGMLTATPGSQRTYASSGLTLGTSYTYQLRVEVEKEGQIVAQDRTITLRAGDAHSEIFDFNASHVAAN